MFQGAENEPELNNGKLDTTPNDGERHDLLSKSDGEQTLSKYETDETKLLSNDQLQRFVLLKQVKILSLHEQRLNGQVVADKDVVIDYVGWDGLNSI